MDKIKNSKFREFLLDMLRGFVIGVGFIIPGFSGGSAAAILGIYEKLINAIADIFSEFKKSVLTLLPVALGMVLGILSMLYPLSWALSEFPLPTVCVFVGLAIGGLPSITDKLGGKPKIPHIFAFAIPLVMTFALSFLPIGSDIDLFGLNIFGYILLFIMGIISSGALVIPGISGSMILLIFGYYNPILNMITEHFLKGKDMGISILVLASIGVGIVIGFVVISIIMKILFKKCPRGTYFAILGFIIGSIPTIYVSTAKDAGLTLSTLPSSPLHWIMCVLMLIFGFVLSFLLVIYAKKKETASKTESFS